MKHHRGHWEPGRLWSLLDMLRVYARPFWEASNLLVRLEIVALQEVRGIEPDAKAKALQIIDGLVAQLDIVGMTFTSKSAARLRLALNNDDVTPTDFVGHVMDLKVRFDDEVDSTYLLSLSAAQAKVYNGQQHWGSDVAQQFPCLLDEIDESYKCFALGRFTASAFHALRCLEAGIIAMSRCLGIPDPTKGHERSWHKRLHEIDSARKEKWPGSSTEGGDKQIFDDLYAALSGMQNPWRNATMHLEQSFDEERAKHLQDIVGGFMRRLAERMDENGQPLA